MAPPVQRQYDIVLLGATGYTGKLTAEYFTESVPTNVKWAVAGRSQAKLESLVKELKSLNSSRSAPATIVISELTAPELTSLAKKTRVLINTIGPYHKYSTPVVQACAENGTHYLDATGETPWVREIIQKFEATAKKNSAILIPEIGVESAPSDLMAYSAVKLIRKVWECGVMDMVASVYDLKTSGPSGGTLATGLGLLDHYSLSAMKEAQNPFCLSPIQDRDHRHTKYPEPATYRKTAMEKFTGVWDFPLLGKLTTSITAGPNVAIVHRSAGKYPYLYGFNFTYEEYMAVSTFATGFLIHVVLSLMTILLIFPPFRVIAKALATHKPGSGPTKEAGKNDRIEMRGVAIAEQLSRIPRKAFVSFIYEGSLYKLTAIFLVEGAMSLIGNQEEIIKKHGYGFLTPSCLGDAYVERLEKAGVKLHVRQVGDMGSK